MTQPEINRDSIYAWKLRYSDLVEELFPVENEEDGGEKANDTESGAEGETEEPKKEDDEVKPKDVDEIEKVVKEGEGKKSEEEAVTCSEKNQENVDSKKESCEGEQEQQSSDGREDTEDNENDSERASVHQTEVEGALLSDSEQKLNEAGTEQEKLHQEKEISTEGKPSDGKEEAGEKKSNRATDDTHL